MINFQILQVGGGGGSTTSSSTEDSEARERRFGSIDLQQPLALKTTPSASVTAADLSKGQSPIDAQLKQALLADFSEFMFLIMNSKKLLLTIVFAYISQTWTYIVWK